MSSIIIFWFQIKKVKIDWQQSARRRQYFLVGFVDNFGFPASWLVENENVNKHTDWSRTKFPVVEKGWIAFGDFCYREFPGPRPWGNARLICEGEHADLAVIRSDEENEFLRKTLTKHEFWVGIKKCLCGKKCAVDYGKLTDTNWAI